MHKFYFTNNLGGGGTNVSRLMVYKDELADLSNIGILLNYYYLNCDFKKSMSFDQDILRKHGDYTDISTFLSAVKSHFIQKERISNSYISGGETKNISSYLLDSGIGNILRDIIINGSLNEESIRQLITPYHQYANSLNFDILITLDHALKYTYKNGETVDANLKRIWNDLVENEEKNLMLLAASLDDLIENEYTFQSYAPLHGYDFPSFKFYGEKIRELEEQKSAKFSGYALGGLANTRDLNNAVWKVPEGLNTNEKSAWIVSKLTEQTRDVLGDSPLHILGAGNIFALPFLISKGATSSDCHSPWRRSSDGTSKILIPLINNDLSLTNNNNIFQYKDINQINTTDYEFNLPLDITIEKLKNLHNSANREDYYYSQIILFIHAIRQYNLLIEYIESNKTDYIQKLSNSNDQKFNDQYNKLSDLLF